MTDVSILRDGDMNYVNIGNKLLTVETVSTIFKNLISPVELYIITKEVCSNYSNVKCDYYNVGVVGDEREVVFVIEDILSILFDLFRDRYDKSMIFDTNKDNNWFIKLDGDVYEDDNQVVGETMFYLIGVVGGNPFGINSLSLADILSRKVGRYIISPEEIEVMFSEFVEKYKNVISGKVEFDPSELTITIRYSDVDSINSGTIRYDFDIVFKIYKEFVGSIIRKVFY